MEEKIQIIIADDNPHFIEGLRVALLKCKNCIIIDECKDGRELVESPYLHLANIVLSDIDMPIINGIKAAQLINYKYPNLPMIALTMHLDKVFLDDIIGAGFKGFIYKPDVAKNLNEGIHAVLNNKFLFPDNLKIK